MIALQNDNRWPGRSCQYAIDDALDPLIEKGGLVCEAIQLQRDSRFYILMNPGR